jgi:hypothetical protein
MSVDQSTVTASSKATTRHRLLLPILIAAIVVLAALSSVLGVLLTQGLEPSPEGVDDFLAERSSVVEQRASELSQLLLNYDATNIEGVADRILEISTGNFREQYEQLIAELGTALEEVSASSRGRILEGPSISFRSASEAIGVLNVTQTTQSRDNPTGRTIDYIWQITFVNVESGGWKADRLEILSQREV